MTDATELAALADLLPCPFCGTTDIELYPCNPKFPKQRRIECGNPGCIARGYDTFYSEREAIERWNTRALASRDGGGWLPIESAPRDGARILLYCNWIGVVRGSWNNDRHAKRPRPYWTNDTENTFGKLRIRECQPYYWQPLPTPPAKAAPLPPAPVTKETR